MQEESNHANHAKKIIILWKALVSYITVYTTKIFASSVLPQAKATPSGNCEFDSQPGDIKTYKSVIYHAYWCIVVRMIIFSSFLIIMELDTLIWPVLINVSI